MKLIFSLGTALFLFIGCSTNNGVTTIVPAAPTSLTGTAFSGTQINLSWVDNATNEVGYKIQRLNTSGNYTDIGSTGADVNTFSDLGLTPSTSYTYRVYAYNSAGNSLQYSNVITVSTSGGGSGGNSVTDIDGNVYPTVQICNQLWTAKNLDVSHYRNGDVIPQVSNPAQWANLTTGAWCYYNNDPALGAIYGKLYNWYAVNDPRGLAPQSWHIPTDTEWNKLVKCIDPNSDTACSNCLQSSTAGGAMKEAGTTHWQSPNTGGTNSNGFAGLPAGYLSNRGDFGDIGANENWWSSADFGTTNNWIRSLYFDLSVIYRGEGGNDIKIVGLSVRLVKD